MGFHQDVPADQAARRAACERPPRVLNGNFSVLRSGGESARRMANQCTRSIVITFDWDLLYCVRVSALGELSFNHTRD